MYDNDPRTTVRMVHSLSGSHNVLFCFMRIYSTLVHLVELLMLSVSSLS